MAEAKKTRTTKAATKTVKEAAPKTAAKATAAKKAEAGTAAVKKTAARTRKAAVKENISIQFAGKEYTTEQLVKIAKDVWEFDLKKDPADFKEALRFETEAREDHWNSAIKRAITADSSFLLRGPGQNIHLRRSPHQIVKWAYKQL